MKGVAGEWISADPVEGSILINVGEMLETFTGCADKGGFIQTAYVKSYLKSLLNMILRSSKLDCLT